MRLLSLIKRQTWLSNLFKIFNNFMIEFDAKKAAEKFNLI